MVLGGKLDFFQHLFKKIPFSVKIGHTVSHTHHLFGYEKVGIEKSLPCYGARIYMRRKKGERMFSPSAHNKQVHSSISGLENQCAQDGNHKPEQLFYDAALGKISFVLRQWKFSFRT